MSKDMVIPGQAKSNVLLFAKFPRPGAVKTRLAEAIGHEKAAQLYTCSVLDTIDFIKRLNFPFEIFYWPVESGAEFAETFGSEYTYVPQQGEDLSQRAINSFRRTFDRGVEYAVTIGTDIPDLPPELIADAFERLESVDVVIGPAFDGGYYLLGFSNRSFTLAAFENISWSTAKVFDETLCALKNQNKTVSILPAWNDIDTIEDLRRFASRGGGAALRTRSYISKEMPWLNDRAAGENYANV